MGAQRAGRWTPWLPAGYSLLLALLITAPLLRSGFLLLRDAVSTPRSYLTDTALGLGDAAPRAVPQDALLATLSVIVDGGVVVKAILVTALWAAGYGAAVLARDLLRAPLAAQLVATTLTVWNPYIAERLLQGHWSLLTGYAALPWIAVAARRTRGGAAHSPAGSRTGTSARWDRFRNWALLGGLLAAAGLTPTGALLGAIIAVTIAGWRRSAGVLLLVAAASVPWLLATTVSGVAAEPSDPAGVPAFAARAEPWLGTVGSLAGLGGIWNADAVPGSRTTPLAAVATVLLLAVVAFGVRRVAAADGDPERVRARRLLLVLAAVAVVLPALAATPAGLAVMEWLVGQVPGAGLFRDTQKFVALAVPGYGLCAAAACAIATGRRSPVSACDTPVRPGDSPLAPGSDGQDTAPPAPPSTPASTSTEALAAAPRPDSGEAPASDSGGTTDPTAGRPADSCPDDTATSRPGDTKGSAPVGVIGPPAETAQVPPGGPAAESGVPAAGTDRNTPATGSRISAPRGPMRASVALAVLFAGMLILPLPDLAWGVGGQVQAVQYPDAWGEVADRIDGPGDIAVLPGGMFRRFPYSGPAPALDPAPRMLPRDVLQTGALPVHGETVTGEGVRARTVEDLLLAGGDATELARLGVGWVLVERDTPGPLGRSATTLAQLEPVFDSEELRLYRVPDVMPRPAPEHRGPVIGAHILWALLLATPLLTIPLRFLSGRGATRRPAETPNRSRSA
ncbi:hypothetical protein IU448_14915 [Nocardia flavorosea]|nr:hypothetical protein [Nocardia flavorosea]MBF6350297.1 hypothetical protein [Nocardia flavorosea]